ncbi:hypothetical protein HIM_02785 [Hirsutella minnesotensis 3608]|nr:hypothetical protein HIM_02785 [Hirsutella minnesotensis 3608]
MDNDPRNRGQKTLHVWSEPIKAKDEAQGDAPSPQELADAKDTRPTLSNALSTIKKEDFLNVAATPCARQGFLVGIGSGAGLGGLKFVLQGNATKAANWGVGMFVLGSILSYEYCQFQRRAERIQMKRHIEMVSESKREQMRKAAEEQQERLRQEQEKKASQQSWYKFW